MLNIVPALAILVSSPFSDDTLVSSIMSRVAARDSATGAIIAVSLPHDPLQYLCYAKNMGFSIEVTDSGNFAVTLSPLHSGLLGGCTPLSLHEEYVFRRSAVLKEEHYRYRQYRDRIEREHNQREAAVAARIRSLTNRDLKKYASICDVFDSLGTGCTVSGFEECDTVMGTRMGGIMLLYPDFSLAFVCQRIYCSLYDAFPGRQRSKSCMLVNADASQTGTVERFVKNCASLRALRRPRSERDR